MSTSAPGPGESQFPAAQVLDAVAQFGRLLELEVCRRGLHLRLELCQVRFELRVGAEAIPFVSSYCHVVPLVHAREHFVDVLDDGGGSDAVLAVVGLLNAAAPI